MAKPGKKNTHLFNVLNQDDELGAVLVNFVPTLLSLVQLNYDNAFVSLYKFIQKLP